jgi:hypothetical protein
MKGRIDRFGGWDDGAARYAIDPYVGYRAVDDLSMFDRCATARQKDASTYYLCFAVDYDRSHRPHLRGLAEVKSRRATRSGARP